MGHAYDYAHSWMRGLNILKLGLAMTTDAKEFLGGCVSDCGS